MASSTGHVDTKKKNIYIHGIIYKAYNAKEDYDGLYLTEKDCLQIVNEFYAKKNGERNIYVNFEHGQQYQDRLGTITDIYYDKSSKTLNGIIEVVGKAIQYDDFRSKMSERKYPMGLSIELNFEYEKIASKKHIPPSDLQPASSTGTDATPVQKKQVQKTFYWSPNGWEIPLKDRKGSSIAEDTKNIRVKSKKMSAVGIVNIPDHYKDGTFITSWIEGTQPSDLHDSKDPLFDKFVNQLELSDSKDGISSEIKLRYSKTIAPVLKPVENKNADIIPNDAKNEVTNAKLDHKLANSQTGDPNSKDLSTNFLAKESPLDKIKMADQGKKDADIKPDPIEETDSGAEEPESKKDGGTTLQLTEEQLQKLINKKVKEELSKQVKKPILKKTGFAKPAQTEQQNHLKPLPNEEEEEAQAEDTEMAENAENENEETDEKPESSGFFQNEPAPNDAQKRKKPDSSESKKAQPPPQKNESKQQKNSGRAGMTYDKSNLNPNDLLFESIQDVTQKMKEYDQMAKNPGGTEGQNYFKKKKQETAGEFGKLCQEVLNNLEEPTEDERNQVIKSFSNNSWSTNPLVEKTMAGIWNMEMSKGHRDAEHVYQRSKQNDGWLNTPESPAGFSSSSSNSMNGYYPQKKDGRYQMPSQGNEAQNRQKMLNIWAMHRTQSIQDRQRQEQEYFNLQQQVQQVNQQSRPGYDNSDMDVDESEEASRHSHQERVARIQHKKSQGLGLPAQRNKDIPSQKAGNAGGGKSKKPQSAEEVYEQYVIDLINQNPNAPVYYKTQEDNEALNALKRQDLVKESGFGSMFGERDYIKEVLDNSPDAKSLKRNLGPHSPYGPLNHKVLALVANAMLTGEEPGHAAAIEKYGHGYGGTIAVLSM